MLYEVTITKDGKVIDNYLATDYKLSKARRRLGTNGYYKVNEEDEITNIAILPQGKNRNKRYNLLYEGVKIQEGTTGRVIHDLKQVF